MIKTRVLSDLAVGQSGRIFKIKPCLLKNRLVELGFTEGTKVCVLHSNIGESSLDY